MKTSSKKYKVLSIFSGIGGLDLGFEKAGFEIVATIEWNNDCCETQKINKDRFFAKQTKIINADITKINPENIYDGKIDFFIGGPPCQTFSAIGRRAGGASGRLDERGSLFEHYCRLLKHYKPAGFMFENVRGILSSNKGKDWADVQEAFSALGYRLKFRVLDAAGYGAAQHRERVILVGNKTNNDFFFPRPSFGPDSKNNKQFITASEAMLNVEHTEDLNVLFPKGGKYDHLLPQVPAGSNYLFYTEEMGHPEPKFAWRSKFSDFLYKAHPNAPVKTIVASMGRYSGPFHWDGRKLSIGELLRLQGFPDGFKLHGGRTSKIKQIGNSVVPLLSYPLALSVKKTIFQEENTKIELLSDDAVLSIDRRKGDKAKKTRSNREANNNSQLSLFVNHASDKSQLPNIILKSAEYLFSYSDNSKINILKKGIDDIKNAFDLKISIDGKNIFVRLDKNDSRQKSTIVTMNLDLQSKSFSSTNRLDFESTWFNPEQPFVIWDAINIAISALTPFPSIHELYGHFTEPNPKFKITDFKIKANNDPIANLMEWMVKMQNTYIPHRLEVLKNMGFDVTEEKNLVKQLRSKRIDIRTNLTNKRINNGHFRVCYPYTLPIDRKSFVTIS